MLFAMNENAALHEIQAATAKCQIDFSNDVNFPMKPQRCLHTFSCLLPAGKYFQFWSLGTKFSSSWGSTF